MPLLEAPDTPLMRQYAELKAGHPEAILFFHLGDFYEMFGADAQAAAPILGLVLTARQGLPMCGVPVHSGRTHIARLLKAGRKVAIAEQTEEAGKGRKLVAREVTRVVTPGTVIEDELLDPTATNYLLALEVDLVGWGAAVVEVSTGEFWATQALNDQGSRRLKALLARVSPSEIIVTSKAAEDLRLADELPKACVTRVADDSFHPGGPWLRQGPWTNHHLAAKAALRGLDYLGKTRLNLREVLEPVYRESAGEMQLDATAIRTLELVESFTGQKRHTLWGQLDCCRTPMGSRALRSWILHPSTDIPEIGRRQGCVSELAGRADIRRILREALAEISDLPRAASRLNTRSGSPRDLAALRDSLAARLKIVELLTQAQFSSALGEAAAALAEVSSGLAPCQARLADALAERPPARLSDGGVIRPGFDAGLDELRALKTDGQGFLARLESQERRATGIPSLKAGYNAVFGYFFEVTKTHLAKVPARFTRKQTLANAERYITPELKELESRILGAEEKMLRLEARLFDALREDTLVFRPGLLALAAALAELDVLAALAEAAASRDYVRPAVDLSHDLTITEGRHPVLESLLAAGSFVPNSLSLDARDPRIIVLTGPNMSGKSTYLRQNALIAVMAQIGSFVPAREAKVGLIDRILTRIGAQDALAQGQSTFMVEMQETAQILKSATARSLLVLDEIGRGTSTFDGISIAWAVLEHLHASYRASDDALGPRVLFATHYFELTELSELLPGVANFNVEAREWTNAEGRTEVVFLHRISPGPADRSYGIHVAALAGLPAGVLTRAREILARLENHAAAAPASQAQGATAPLLPLFEDNPVLQTLRLLDIDSLTPLEALKTLAELKRKV